MFFSIKDISKLDLFSFFKRKNTKNNQYFQYYLYSSMVKKKVCSLDENNQEESFYLEALKLSLVFILKIQKNSLSSVSFSYLQSKIYGKGQK